MGAERYGADAAFLADRNSFRFILIFLHPSSFFSTQRMAVEGK
jgi:hypothetical protein